MKKIALLLLLCLLVGCAPKHYIWVNVDTPNKTAFSIYMDEQKICETGSECRVDFGSFNDNVVLDARKDRVVYGKLIVKKKKTVSYTSTGVGVDKSLHFTEAVGQSNPVLGIAVGMLVIPVAIIDWLTPSVSSSFPKKVTIPIASPNSPDPYPWDQPEKE